MPPITRSQTSRTSQARPAAPKPAPKSAPTRAPARTARARDGVYYVRKILDVNQRGVLIDWEPSYVWQKDLDPGALHTLEEWEQAQEVIFQIDW